MIAAVGGRHAEKVISLVDGHGHARDLRQRLQRRLIGLLLFLRKAIETLRGAEQLRVGHITIPEIGAGRRGAFF